MSLPPALQPLYIALKQCTALQPFCSQTVCCAAACLSAHKQCAGFFQKSFIFQKGCFLLGLCHSNFPRSVKPVAFGTCMWLCFIKLILIYVWILHYKWMGAFLLGVISFLGFKKKHRRDLWIEIRELIG